MESNYKIYPLTTSKFRQNMYAWYLPAEMKRLSNWVAFRSVPSDKGIGKYSKQLINPNKNDTIAWAKSNDPSTWADYKTAYDFAISHKCTGVAFALQKELEICCIDIDHCFKDDVLSIEASEVLALFEGTYCERSISGNGLHIFCKGKLPKEFNQRNELVEMYDDVRFISMTGTKLKDAPKTLKRFKNLSDLNVQLLGERIKPVPRVQCFESSDIDEQFIIDKLMANPMTNALMKGDTSMHNSDHSRADFALCRQIAFYTKNEEVISSIFRKSLLYREKWDNSQYGDLTMSKALESQTKTYNPRAYYTEFHRLKNN